MVPQEFAAMSLSGRVGQRIKSLRKRRGLSQVGLAQKIGRSVDAVSGLERGKSLPSFETLDRLANALDVPIKEFFDFGSEAKKGTGSDSTKRAALMATLIDLARSLSDRDLTTAIRLVETIAERSK
jgi:transcriptional regulator with XRE-family HTH domain